MEAGQTKNGKGDQARCAKSISQVDRSHTSGPETPASAGDEAGRETHRESGRRIERQGDGERSTERVFERETMRERG